MIEDSSGSAGNTTSDGPATTPADSQLLEQLDALLAKRNSELKSELRHELREDIRRDAEAIIDRRTDDLKKDISDLEKGINDRTGHLIAGLGKRFGELEHRLMLVEYGQRLDRRMNFEASGGQDTRLDDDVPQPGPPPDGAITPIARWRRRYSPN
jgi:hypothetical protein